MMEEKELKELFDKAKEKWGIDSQLMMLAEELSELTVATLHLFRNNKDKTETYLKFAEEFGDAKLMMEEMEHYFPQLWRDAEIFKNTKLKRLQKMLE